MDIKKIMEKIINKNRISRLCFMVVGVFLLALNYNLFFVPNNLVTGGVSGLAIVFNNLFGWQNQIFISIANVLLLFVSFKLLGYSKTRNAIIGSLLYPLMIWLTAPLALRLIPLFTFDDFVITLVCASIVNGFANGLIYKMGYNTGGSDILMAIIRKYGHVPPGKANFISSLIIIAFAGLVLGVKPVIYAVVITYITSIIVDKMLSGISKSKLFIIQTSKISEIMDVIINDLHIGATILKAEGGYSSKKQDLIMVAISTKDYVMFKEVILAIDKDAFFIINDCYDTEGGMIGNNSLLSNLF